MSGNHLVGPVPAVISGCASLQFLDLHSNALSGALPDALPRSLQLIDVSDNQLSGPLRPGITSMPELTKLYLGKNRLLFYGYLPNGSLSGLLHGGAAKKGAPAAEWGARYDVAVGVAYLHHDCVPAILHGDIKSMNVLLGPAYEPYLADFGLARVMSGSNKLDPAKPHRIAGSYGYMAPEHASMQRISEKSDVYSFGVVVLEILTGRHPLDPTLPGGAHLVQWVQAQRDDAAELLDARLTSGSADADMHEMRQALCVSHRADDRPAMKDVVALLKEIRRPAGGDDAKQPPSLPASGAAQSPMHSSSGSFPVSEYSA